MGQLETLNNKYRRALARIQDLEELQRKRSEQWGKRESDHRIVEKNTRDLCEMILASDPEEMKLGKNKSWSETPILQLLRNAVNAWTKHEKAFQATLDNLMDELEKRTDENNDLRGKIADLERKINILNVHSSNVSIEDVDKIIEDEKEKKKQTELKKNLGISSKSARVVEEDDDDEDPIEESLLDDAADTNASAVKITDSSIPYIKNSRNRGKDFNRQKKAQINQENLSEKSDWLSDEQWDIIRIMGETGISLYANILTKYKEEKGVDAASDSKIKLLTNQLVDRGVISRETETIYTGMITIHILQPLGMRFYLDRFGKKAVEPEAEIIKREHNNYKHGYGIKMLADALRKTGEYKEVNEFQRKKAMVVRGRAAQYIPDILTIDKRDLVMYIEYEVGTTPQADFNAKCSKLTKVKRTLNFVVPNNTVAEETVKKIQKFIDNKGSGNSLYGITIRLASAKAIAGGGLISNASWKYVFKPERKGTEPEINY